MSVYVRTVLLKWNICLEQNHTISTYSLLIVVLEYFVGYAELKIVGFISSEGHNGFVTGTDGKQE